jgi:hypothetical protein
LNTKPLQIDLLVIKKPKDIRIENDFGKLFREHNILEYKSPGDKLDEDVVLKVCAYACLYKVQEEKLGAIDLDEITITIVRDDKPVSLLKKLRERKITITTPYPGIYYIDKDGLFPFQIVVSKELSGKDHEWLKALTRDAQKEDIRTFLNSAKMLHGKYERTLLDSVLQVAIQANQGKYIEVKEDVEKMSTAYQILFAKEIQEAEKEREQLTAQAEKLTAQIEEVQEQRDQEKKEREQLTAQIEAVQEQRDELTAERDQALAEADMLRKELERMKAQLAGTNT